MSEPLDTSAVMRMAQAICEKDKQIAHLEVVLRRKNRRIRCLEEAVWKLDRRMVAAVYRGYRERDTK